MGYGRVVFRLSVQTPLHTPIRKAFVHTSVIHRPFLRCANQAAKYTSHVK
jgi:hypothetical protein